MGKEQRRGVEGGGGKTKEGKGTARGRVIIHTS